MSDQPKRNRRAKRKPGGTAKPKTARPRKPQGGGGGTSAEPISTMMDSDSEKISQCGRDETPTEDPKLKADLAHAEELLKEAAFCLLDGTKTLWSKPPHLRDHLIDLMMQNPKRAKDVMHFMGKIMRTGLAQVLAWSHDKEHPKISAWAQVLLADLVHELKESGMAKLPLSSIKYGIHFSMRWDQMNPEKRKQGKYAAVRRFAVFELPALAEQMLGEVFETLGGGSDDEPAHKKTMRRLMLDLLVAVGETGENPIRWEAFKGLWEDFMSHPLTREMAWEKISWPLAQEKWPMYARENEHFTGWGDMKLGAPLSQRMRAVDGKTDFGIVQHQSTMKTALFKSLELGNRLDGTGSDALSAEEGRST